MEWLEKWQHGNRERFPNAAAFFDEFKKAHDEITADVVQGAVEGASGSLLGHAIFKARPSPLVLAIDSLIGGGIAAGKHVVDASSELIANYSSSGDATIDASVLSYVSNPSNKPKSATLFYHSVNDLSGSNAHSVNELGCSSTEFELRLVQMIENKFIPSDQTIKSIERAVLTLPVKQLEATLNDYLTQMHITDPTEKGLYRQALRSLIEQRSGAVQQGSSDLSPDERQRMYIVGSIVNMQTGLNSRLHTIEQSLHQMPNTITQVLTAKTIKSQIDHQQAVMNARTISDSFQLLYSIGEMTGSQNLQKVAVIGQSSYKIVSELTQLGGLISAGTLTLSAFMSSISVIGMAGSVIMKLFGKKDNSDEIYKRIMRQLRELAQQMVVFRNEVIQQFIQVHNNQRLIYDAVCQGFNLIYFSIKAESEDLKYSVISRLEDIQSHLMYLEQQVGDGYRQLSTQPLLEAMSTVERYYGQYEKNNVVTLTAESFQSLMDRLTFWLISEGNIIAQCKTPQLTGMNMLPTHVENFSAHDYKRMLCVLNGNTHQLGQSLGFFLSYAKRYLLTKQAQSLASSFGEPVNIEIWASIVDAYIKLRKLGASAGIKYPQGDNELETILQDSENTLGLLKSFHQVSTPLFSQLTELYNQSLEYLSSQVKGEVSRIMRDEVVNLGDSAAKMSLQDVIVTVNYKGKSNRLLLTNATSNNTITVPAIFLLAKELALGQFSYSGDRSVYTEESVVKRNPHRFTVDVLSPAAHFIIDAFFQFNNETPIQIATAERKRGGNPGTKATPQIPFTRKIKPHVPTVSSLEKHWNSNETLSFTLSVNGPDDNYVRLIEAHLLRKHISTILSRDSVRDAILRLNFYAAIINGYGRIIGNMGQDFYTKLISFKSGDEMARELSDNIPSASLTLFTSIDTVLGSFFPKISSNWSMNNDGDTNETLQSPLAFTVIEKMSELSSLCVSVDRPALMPIPTTTDISTQLTKANSSYDEMVRLLALSPLVDKDKKLAHGGSVLALRSEAKKTYKSIIQSGTQVTPDEMILVSKRLSSLQKSNPEKNRTTDGKYTKESIVMRLSK